MTRRDAERLVAHGALTILDNGSDQPWLDQDMRGNPLSPADRERTRAAFERLVAALRRRAGGAPA